MLGHFHFQKKLDADDAPLVDRNNVKMVRDIVQFVPLNKIKEQGISLVSCTLTCTAKNFTYNNLLFGGYQEKEVLAEIPDQFLSYMKQRNIQPNQPQENKQQP